MLSDLAPQKNLRATGNSEFFVCENGCKVHTAAAVTGSQELLQWLLSTARPPTTLLPPPLPGTTRSPPPPRRLVPRCLSRCLSRNTSALVIILVSRRPS